MPRDHVGSLATQCGKAARVITGDDRALPLISAFGPGRIVSCRCWILGVFAHLLRHIKQIVVSKSSRAHHGDGLQGPSLRNPVVYGVIRSAQPRPRPRPWARSHVWLC